MFFNFAEHQDCCLSMLGFAGGVSAPGIGWVFFWPGLLSAEFSGFVSGDGFSAAGGESGLLITLAGLGEVLKLRVIPSGRRDGFETKN